MINKDFIKALLANEKKFLTMNEVKLCNVPLYPELSIDNLYKRALENDESEECAKQDIKMDP